MKNCLQLNLQALDKVLSMLDTIDTERYQQKHSNFFEASVGGHVRHIIEFYELFISSYEGNFLDYNERSRNPILENEPEKARQAIVTIKEELTSLVETHADGMLSVVSEAHQTCISSRGRELEFLAGHTVHHNAVIVSMCDSMFVEVDNEMAFAPSTLAYQG